jgi:hypothetical protein
MDLAFQLRDPHLQPLDLGLQPLNHIKELRQQVDHRIGSPVVDLANLVGTQSLHGIHLYKRDSPWITPILLRVTSCS